MGFKTLEDELDPDKKLRMVEEFANRFPNSELLSYVYTQAARACLQKNDWSLGVDYGRKSLKLDPDNFYSMLVLATTLAQPRSTLENANRLSTAQNNASRALELIATMQKGISETDEQFQKRKQGLEADAHAALALVYMQGDESAKAIDEFKTAISLAEQPNPQLYFRMGEIYANEGKKDEAINAFTKASQLGQGTIVQRYADDRIQKLKKQ
jgi:tetratricopeptide (TPR) repeat protein